MANFHFKTTFTSLKAGTEHNNHIVLVHSCKTLHSGQTVIQIRVCQAVPAMACRISKELSGRSPWATNWNVGCLCPLSTAKFYLNRKVQKIQHKRTRRFPTDHVLEFSYVIRDDWQVKEIVGWDKQCTADPCILDFSFGCAYVQIHKYCSEEDEFPYE